jgi:hypothetical protein
MPLAFRLLYTAAAIIIFSQGVLLHLSTPMARAIWIPWAVAALALLALALRALHRDRGLGLDAVNRALGRDPAQGAAPFVFLLIVLGLSLICLFVEMQGPRGVGYLVSGSFSLGLWAPLGVMLFFGLKLGRARVSWIDAGLSLLGLLVSVYILAVGAYHYSARLLVLSIFCLVFMIRGNRRLKVLVLSFLGVYFCLGILVVTGRHIGYYPWYLWAFSGMSEPNAALDLILRQTVFRLAGLWGTGGAYIQEVGLPVAESMGLNAVPYLALLGGVFAVGLYTLSLLLLMGALLVNILELKGGWAGTLAVSAWFILAIDQYLAFLAMLTPSALILGGGFNGLPFIGSFETGLALLALLFFVVAAHGAARRAALEAGALGPGGAGEAVGGEEKEEGDGEEREEGDGEEREGGAPEAGPPQEVQ